MHRSAGLSRCITGAARLPLAAALPQCTTARLKLLSHVQHSAPVQGCSSGPRAASRAAYTRGGHGIGTASREHQSLQKPPGGSGDVTANGCLDLHHRLDLDCRGIWQEEDAVLEAQIDGR